MKTKPVKLRALVIAHKSHHSDKEAEERCASCGELSPSDMLTHIETGHDSDGAPVWTRERYCPLCALNYDPFDMFGTLNDDDIAFDLAHL